MRIYFLRHADAQDGLDDASRPLSDKGLKQCRTLARFLKRAGIEFDAVCTSPLLRARQTAELVGKLTSPSLKGRIEVSEALLNETPDAMYSRWLKSKRERHDLLLVGHAPTLAERAAGLLGMGASSALRLPKAGLVCVESEDAVEGTLRFFVTAKLLA